MSIEKGPGEIGYPVGEEPLTPEERKQRTMNEGELLKRGAEYTHSGRLEATDEQRMSARREMNADLLARDLQKHFSAWEIRYLTAAVEDLLERIKKDEHQDKGVINEIQNLHARLTGAVNSIRSGDVKSK